MNEKKVKVNLKFIQEQLEGNELDLSLNSIEIVPVKELVSDFYLISMVMGGHRFKIVMRLSKLPIVYYHWVRCDVIVASLANQCILCSNIRYYYILCCVGQTLYPTAMLERVWNFYRMRLKFGGWSVNDLICCD